MPWVVRLLHEQSTELLRMSAFAPQLCQQDMVLTGLRPCRARIFNTQLLELDGGVKRFLLFEQGLECQVSFGRVSRIKG